MRHDAPENETGALSQDEAFMPLMNTSFAPGECLEAPSAMAEGALRDIAWAEYYYFSGLPEK
mgnify:FL=1